MFHETPGKHENPNKTAQLRGFIVGGFKSEVQHLSAL